MNYAPVEDARKSFATQINQFQTPGASEMNIAAPDTKQALLYNCRRQGKSIKEGLPGVEELGNGLVKVPFGLFPKYIRFIAYLDKW